MASSARRIHEIRRKSLGRWSFTLSSSPRDQRRERAALNALADARERAVLDRISARELALADVVAALAPGGAGVASLRPRFTGISLSAACNALLSERSTSPRNTQRIAAVVSRQLTRYFGADRAVRTITFAEVQTWLRGSGWSAVTQQQKRSIATRIWQLAEKLERDHAHADARPHESLVNHWLEIREPRTRSSEERWLDVQESHAMLDRLLLQGRLRDATFLACGFFAGLRIGEACALRWADISFVDETLRVAVRADWHPKTRRSARTVFVPTRMLELLQRWREQAPAGAYVFAGTSALPERTAERWARLALDAAGLPEFVFHKGRHSAITNALAAGISVPEAVEQFGVSAKTLISTYAHVLVVRRPRIARVWDLTPSELPVPENDPE
jgi:integrase